MAVRESIPLLRESDAVVRASGDAVMRAPGDAVTRDSYVEKLVSFSSRLFREVIS